MNKAFVREPEPDGRGYCPQCDALGIAVGALTLDAHVLEGSQKHLGETAWFCSYPRCGVAYFNEFDAVVEVEELKSPVYPKDDTLPICPCFGFERTDIEADVSDGTPHRIRELLAKSKSPDARCRTLAADGKCCMTEVQRIYMRLTTGGGE
jgi:hypothetical protein